jgi:4-amino-4-deoxy-L-arabinose transferase-like glycosyltransferase
MTTSSDARRTGVLAPIERIVDALVDPRRRERAAIVVLAAYALAWWCYAVIAKSSQDLHFDMGEMVAVSREHVLGTAKHPPMGAWLVGLWFGVFPLADWAYYLFAVLVATAGLWIAWRLAADYLDPDKRVIGLALLTLVPLYNFQALKFNANSVLIPLWALTTWLFLRSFETRNLGLAAFAGLAAAAAMLGKYWSIVLLAGLALAALADPRRAGYFRSGAPWVTVAFGAIALVPHTMWLVLNDFPPMHYSTASHALASRWDALLSSLTYLGGGLAYLAAPIVLVLLMRPSLSAIGDTLWPADLSRRTVLLAFALPLVLPIPLAVAASASIPPIWAMSAMTLVPVVLLSSPLFTVSRAATVRIVALAVVVPLLMIVASPLIAVDIHRNGLPNDAARYRLLAEAIDRAWRDTSSTPLRVVASNTNLVNGVLPYLPGRPSTYEMYVPTITPWVDDIRIAREGMAIVCRADDAPCNATAKTLADRFGGGRTVEVDLSRPYFGIAGPAVRYRILTLPPTR